MSDCDPHRDAELLKAYGLGKVSRAAAEAIALHLEHCADCRRIVADAPPDRFLRNLQLAVAAGSGAGTAPRDGGLRTDASLPPTATASASADFAAPAERREARSDQRGVVTMPPPALADFPPAAPLVVAAGPATTRAVHEGVPAALLNNPDYEMLKELSRGGMGVVYLVRNRRMDRLECLKVVNAELLQSSGAMERFEREMRSAAKVNHPNIVTAYSSPPLPGLLAFAMEYIDGTDLNKLVQAHGALPVSIACYYIHQAAKALQYAATLTETQGQPVPAERLLATIVPASASSPSIPSSRLSSSRP